MSTATSQSNNKGEHTTHTTALVLMVAFTVFVLVSALGGVDINRQSNPADDTQAQAAETTTTDAETANDALAGIPVDQNAVVENRMVTYPNGQASEQVISFESAMPASELLGQYESWMNEAGYTVEKQRRSERAASIAATRGESALILMISYLDQADLSRVEIINYKRS